MEKTMSRRAALAGFLALPAIVPRVVPAKAATVVEWPLNSAVPQLVERYHRACAAIDAAAAVFEPLSQRVADLNESDPIMVDLPGFRPGTSVRYTNTTREWIIRRYRDTYGIITGKGGMVFRGGNLVALDYSADLERDLNAALANFDAGTVALLKRADDVGESAAGVALDEAYEEKDAAVLALASYAARTRAESRDKAAALLDVLNAEGDAAETDRILRALIASISQEA